MKNRMAVDRIVVEQLNTEGDAEYACYIEIDRDGDFYISDSAADDRNSIYIPKTMMLDFIRACEKARRA